MSDSVFSGFKMTHSTNTLFSADQVLVDNVAPTNLDDFGDVLNAMSRHASAAARYIALNMHFFQKFAPVIIAKAYPSLLKPACKGHHMTWMLCSPTSPARTRGMALRFIGEVGYGWGQRISISWKSAVSGGARGGDCLAGCFAWKRALPGSTGKLWRQKSNI